MYAFLRKALKIYVNIPHGFLRACLKEIPALCLSEKIVISRRSYYDEICLFNLLSFICKNLFCQ